MISMRYRTSIGASHKLLEPDNAPPAPAYIHYKFLFNLEAPIGTIHERSFVKGLRRISGLFSF
jgi:hypothetical protein